MGLSAALGRWAFGRPRAFPVIAPGGRQAWHDFLDGDAAVATGAPHDADLLVVSGDMPPGWDAPVRRLFETFALPRAAVSIADDGQRRPEGVPFVGATPPIQALGDPAAPGNRPLLPDEPPAPWRGLGDHGQGGEGMMGGKPYGRPMAMTGPDPDDLALSDTPVALGPFFPQLPHGLVLRLRKQGQRIREVEVVENLVPEHDAPTPARPVAAVEGERIERHLLACAAQLALLGLPQLAERFRRRRTTPLAAEVDGLFRWADRAGIRRLLQGLGTLDPAAVRGLCGPVARAAGIAVDPRTGDEGYRGLDVIPVVHEGGDAWARWCVRRREAMRSAGLAAAAGDRETRLPAIPVVDSRRLLDLLPGVLGGLLWSEALPVLASLDIDATEAATR